MNTKKLRIVRSTVVLAVLGVGVSMTFGRGSPTRISGGGEAIAAQVVMYLGHDGVVRSVPSFTRAPFDGEVIVGNRITFGFNATKDADGTVRGQTQLVDHDIGISIHSDVFSLSVPHGVHAVLNGAAGITASMRSTDGGVMVNGQPMPGWRLVNSPLFDGGEGKSADPDTLCFELFRPKLPGEPQPPGDPPGLVRVLQWSAIVSAGNIQIVH